MLFSRKRITAKSWRSSAKPVYAGRKVVRSARHRDPRRRRAQAPAHRQVCAQETMKKITKAVFPVAGLGSRFLPVTKASPKEMLPIVDKPLIQYAVEEAAAAGINEMIFITGRNKRAIEDHFDSNPELESTLQAQGKQ